MRHKAACDGHSIKPVGSELRKIDVFAMRLPLTESRPRKDFLHRSIGSGGSREFQRNLEINRIVSQLLQGSGKNAYFFRNASA
jgi:hypothetical protein